MGPCNACSYTAVLITLLAVDLSCAVRTDFYAMGALMRASMQEHDLSSRPILNATKMQAHELEQREKQRQLDRLKSMDLKTALEKYGHCIVEAVTILKRTVGTNPLMQEELLTLITEKLKTMGHPPPTHGFLKLKFMPMRGCEVESSGAGRGNIIVEHNANIGFWPASVYHAKFTKGKVMSGDVTEFQHYAVTPTAESLEPCRHGSPFPRISLFGIFWRLFQAESRVYGKNHNPEHYDVFTRNCFHFVEALLELMLTPSDLEDFQGKLRSVYDPVKLETAFRDAQHIRREMIGTEVKRALVGLASWWGAESIPFDQIERSLSERVDGAERPTVAEEGSAPASEVPWWRRWLG